MRIETKFKIRDLLRREYDTPRRESITVLDVMEINSQTCYAGTQVFYTCRPILLNRIYKPDGWEVSHAIGNEDGSTGWVKYREDELLLCSKEVIDIVHSVIEKPTGE